MDIQISQEKVQSIDFKSSILAKISLLLSFPLNFCSPELIETILNSISKDLNYASVLDIENARNAVCYVSRKCRNQDGCLKRSLAVYIYIFLCRKKCSWCTGFIMDPFRAHAWIELGGVPIGENEEITRYTHMIKTKDTYEKIVYQFEKNEEYDDNKSYHVRIRDLFKDVSFQKKEFILVFILGILSTFFSLIQPELLSELIKNDITNIFSSISFILFITTVFLATICSTFQYFYLQKIGELAIYKTRKNLVSRMFNLHISDYDNWSIGDFISRVGSDTSKLRLGIIQLTVSLSSSLILSIGAIFLLFFKDFWLSIITLLTLTVVFFVILLMSTIIQKASFDVQKHTSKLSSLLTRDLLGIRTIRAFNKTECELDKTNYEINSIKELGLKLSKVQALLTPISNLGIQFSLMIVIGVGSYRVFNNLMAISDLTAFILLLYMAIGPFSQIFTSISGISESLGALSRIQEVVNLPVERDYDVDIHERFQSNEGAIITFKNVYFTYSKKFHLEKRNVITEYILNNIYFDVYRGEYIAIVGPSGAGKSTILQILERFYEIDLGSILVDGVDIKKIDRFDLRKNLAYVEQNAPLLTGTLLENIRFGNEEVSELECLSVLKDVGLQYLVDRNPDGLNMLIGENSVGLSGGERQRIALARALLSKAQILLLDEMTSNLDSISEKQIKKVLKNIHHKKTIISVAHRLSTVIEADRIMVLEHGRVVGEGTHSQLLESVPLYKELAKEQLLV